MAKKTKSIFDVPTSALLVSFIGRGEVLVCLKSVEKEFVAEVFTEEYGRDIEDYDRTEHGLQAMFKTLVDIHRNS